MAKIPAKPKKSSVKKAGKGAKRKRRGVLDLPKATKERMAEGRAQQEEVPLEAHADWSSPPDRPDPVGTIDAQNRSRVADLVPIRHGRMVVSPFTFFRGGAAIMAWDLSRTPTTGLRVQCCGDAHLSNFGVFAAPDRRMVFDLNDFDETLPAPFEWDVKRLAASLAVAAQDNGFKPKQQRAAARSAVSAYRETIAQLATRRFLDVWYDRTYVDDLLKTVTPSTPTARKQLQKGIEKAKGKTSLGSLERFAEKVDGTYRIKEQPPVIVKPPAAMEDQLEEIVHKSLGDYRGTLSPDRRVVLDNYHYMDFARKVVGVGSVGTEALMVLFMGDREDDPLFLQLKEAQTSVLAPYAGDSEYKHEGERVVQGQRLMQSAGDSLLGWLTGAGGAARQFYVRQLRDMKGSVATEAMLPPGLARYGTVCGATLARAHARTGDAAKIAGYLGEDDSFDRAIEQFSIDYADQSDADYIAFERAIADERLPVQRGV